ncbi:MAG TPA: hypothetical protein VM096_20330 [Vicinamibacterales bacterium]|nr:hypothetical protein [Vicinamibacterales bacterium]
MARHEVATRRVLYEIRGMDAVRARKDEFPGANGQPLPMEIYEAINPISDAVVAIVEGYADAGFEKHVGCKFMEMEWAISMAQLIAASGMTAITHSNRDPEPDAIALMKHLGAKTSKVGIWSTSGHGPVALAALAHATCAVLTNPVVFPQDPKTPRPQDPRPLFIVRAGRDETPGLNAALDPFLAKAIADNRPITVVNYPDAPHAFELSVNNVETRRILQQGLDFLRANLE